MGRKNKIASGSPYNINYVLDPIILLALVDKEFLNNSTSESNEFREFVELAVLTDVRQYWENLLL